MTASACAPGWVAPRPGRTVFSVENRSAQSTYEVDLVGPDQVSVYGAIELLAPRTADTMDVVLPPGSYSFECDSFAGGTLASRVARVWGPVRGPAVSGADPFTPVDPDELRLATLSYRASLAPWLHRLQRDTRALAQAIAVGSLSSARRLWLPAHLDYERLGAGYDTFGDLDTEIDGRPLGLPKGVDDPGFHGFLRLEYGLWHGQTAAALRPPAALLMQSVDRLVSRFPQLQTGPNEVSLRTHEILENTLQFELTGEADEGSHTSLATAWANVQGTELALAAISPLLARSDPGLARSAKAGLVRLGALLAADRRRDGSWQPLQSLTTPQREQLDSATGALLERLSPIPDRLEVTAQSSSDDGRNRD